MRLKIIAKKYLNFVLILYKYHAFCTQRRSEMKRPDTYSTIWLTVTQSDKVYVKLYSNNIVFKSIHRVVVFGLSIAYMPKKESIYISQYLSQESKAMHAVCCMFPMASLSFFYGIGLGWTTGSFVCHFSYDKFLTYWLAFRISNRHQLISEMSSMSVSLACFIQSNTLTPKCRDAYQFHLVLLKFI